MIENFSMARICGGEWWDIEKQDRSRQNLQGSLMLHFRLYSKDSEESVKGLK